MKIELLLRLEGARFAPADPYTDERMQRDLVQGHDYTAAISDKRSLGQNNLYWAGLAYAVKNIEQVERQWPTAELLHDALLKRLGYYTEVPFIMIKRKKVSASMIEAGRRAAAAIAAGTNLPDEFFSAIYRAMQQVAPDYGMNIVRDSTRFEAMRGADFTDYFERAKLVILDMTGRDPWAEWVEARKQKVQ